MIWIVIGVATTSFICLGVAWAYNSYSITEFLADLIDAALDVFDD